MQVYLQAGQHSAALQQYQSCEKILRRELGLDPQPETHQLYKQIRKGALGQTPVLQKAVSKHAETQPAGPANIFYRPGEGM